MSELCPREILFNGVPSESLPFPIPDALKIGGFESIVSFSRLDVYVMPLLCKEFFPYCIDYDDKEKRTEFQKEIFNSETSNRICESSFDPAHLYIFTTKIKKHYIVAFIDCGKLQETEVLVTRLFETANWLTILDECPVFYVYYYGKQDKELGKEKPDNVILENVKRKMNKKIKNCVAYKNKDKDVFFTNTLPSSPEKSKKFIIKSKGNEIWFNPG